MFLVEIRLYDVYSHKKCSKYSEMNQHDKLIDNYTKSKEKRVGKLRIQISTMHELESLFHRVEVAVESHRISF